MTRKVTGTRRTCPFGLVAYVYLLLVNEGLVLPAPGKLHMHMGHTGHSPSLLSKEAKNFTNHKEKH